MKNPAIISYSKFFASICLGFMLGCSNVPLQKEQSVADVMNNVITHVYQDLDEGEINDLNQEKVLQLLDESQLEVLSRKHWVFDVNVPANIYIMRSKSQKIIPFWLETAGFQKTDMEMQNDYHTYEVWEKQVDPGTVELGINGFENFTYHYFVAVGPHDSDERLEVSVKVPENQYVGVLEVGAFTYHDWTELVLKDVPQELTGYKLLTTIRGRGKESHLVGAFRKTQFPSSSYPDQVMLTWSDNPSTTADIQWRTDTTVAAGEVRYRIAGTTDILTVDADKSIMEDRELMNDRFIHRFTARLRELEPDTQYEYIISPIDKWEDAFTFTTAGSDDSWSFVWFGDVHNKPEFGELHDIAEENHPDAAFYSIAGDLVGDGLYRDQWDELFEYSKDVLSKKPLMNVPGNHDNRMGLGAWMYRDMFSYPANGPDDVPAEQTYSFVYRNALFLMLDVTSGVENQADWIEKQLAQSDATWKIAVFHFPPYNHQEPYLNIQKEWVPLFDKYHVDMVYSGHMHYYMRSKPMNSGQVVDTYEDGTAYIISLGIPGRSQDAEEEPYAIVRDFNGWMYQYVSIDDNHLQYQAINRDGKLIDEFEIKK